MSTHAPAAGHGHGSTAKPKKGGKGMLIAILGALIFFFLIKGMFFGSNPTLQPSNNAQGQNNKAIMQTVATTSPNTQEIEVDYTAEFGEEVGIPDGYFVTFFNATEPYCAKNAGNREFYGKKGEDVDLGANSSDNKRIRIKSTTGKKGHVRIILRSKS